MIDIIIPAYNAFDTIARALTSIARQINHNNVKVYIINDGSQDSYYPIMENYNGILDITEIVIDNSGPGAARQKGLEVSENEYILFMDADDQLADEYSLLNLVNIMYGADLAQGKFIQKGENDEKVLDPQYCYLHGKMYRRSIIQNYNIYFDITRRYNGDIYEDSTFNQLYTMYCNNIATTDSIVYIYEFNPKSITRVNYEKVNHLRNFVDAMNWLMRQVQERNITNKLTIAWDVYAICYHAYYNYLIAQEDSQFVFDEMKDIKKAYKKYKDDLPYEDQVRLFRDFSTYDIIPNITFYDFMKKVHS